MAGPGPGGWSVFVPTGPAPDYKAFLEDDPFYKQNLEWINSQEQKDKTRLAEDKAYSQQLFSLNQQQAMAAANSGGDYGLGAAQANAALAKEKAAHDNALRAEYLNEWMASRGLADSGQKAWEQNERSYQFDMYNRGVDQDLSARAADAAEARARAQASLQMQLQEMALRNEGTLRGFAREEEDLPGSYAKARGDAAFDTYNRLKADGKLNAPGVMAMWDEESQLYVTKDGKYYDAFGNPTSWSKQGAGGGGSAPAAGPTTPAGVPYAPWVPGTNQLPGGWGYE